MSIKSWVSKNAKLLERKTIVITGTTNGIGYECLKVLASLDANIFVGVRNTERAEIQRKEILELFPSSKITILKLDLSNLESINNFIEKILALCSSGIDALINNAGVFLNETKILKYGYEKHFFVNFLAPIFLSKKLLPLLEKNTNSKLLFVSSLSFNWSEIDFNNIDFKNAEKQLSAYANSKRWLTFYSIELKKELLEKQSNTDVVLIHPGVTSTALFSNSPFKKFAGLLKLFCTRPKKACLNEIAGLFFKTTEKQWIGPKLFGVWGYPKVSKLKIKNSNENQIKNCYLIANKMVFELENVNFY